MKPPRIYAAIAGVARDVSASGLAKSGVNEEEGYCFRTIDDVYNLLSPILAKRRLCILPRILSSSSAAVRSRAGDVLTRVSLKVAFDFICATDGSVVTVEMEGEALDASDKATSKAVTAAYKSVVFQTFCIPLFNEETEKQTHRIARLDSSDVPEPVQGWVAWSDDLASMINGCESKDALDRVYDRYRGELAALARHAPGSFRSIGAALQIREKALNVGYNTAA